MGALSRLRSLRVSASFTFTAARVRGIAPPCYSPKRLLPLLLVALGFITGATEARADEIILKSHTSATSEQHTYVGLMGGWNYWRPVSMVTESQSENTYIHGAGRTNMNRSLREDVFIYFEPEYPVYDGDPDTYSRYITNRDTFAWGTNGLLPGNGTNSDHLIEYCWLLSVSTLQTDTNNVVPTTNVTAPAAVSSPWPLGMFGSMVTNYDGTNITGTTTNHASEDTTVSLVTSGTNTNNSALYCLTGSVIDPYLYWPTQTPVTAGWKLADLVPDTLGRVFKVFNDGTTNGASVALGSSLTGTNYYYTYTVSPERVGLALQWRKSTSTSDGDWQTARCMCSRAPRSPSG